MAQATTLVVLCIITAAAPGPQSARRHNTTTQRLERGCLLAEFVNTALCYHGNGTGYHLVCERGITAEWMKGEQWVEELTIMDWPGICLSVKPLQHHYPALKTLRIQRSSTLNTFRGHFAANCTIEKLIMRELRALHELPEGLVSRMPYLRELDLRANGLRHLRATSVRLPPKLTTVYLTDNLVYCTTDNNVVLFADDTSGVAVANTYEQLELKLNILLDNGWDCSDGGLDWLAMELSNGTARTRIADYYKLMCHQRLYRGKPLHIVMDIIRTVSNNCPPPCVCNMTHVVTDPLGVIVPLITVDCAERELHAAPSSLPPNTTTLRLQGNQIAKIGEMVQYPYFQRLLDLYLDNNTIGSLTDLEGSEWLTTFRVLSLRGNTLTQVPTFAFDKAFQRNRNIANVYLGNNPWRCDCHYTPKFKDFVLKYSSVIRDLPDIKCSRSDDKKISLKQISSIKIADICRESEAFILRPIDIVNLVLAALVVLVLGRFFYDWHSFKTTGKLPWISSILP